MILATRTLETDTRVSGANGAYAARVHAGWEILWPLGGYLAAIALRAVALESTLPFPVSFQCQFFAQPKVGEVSLKVTALQRRRTMEAFSVEVQQQGESLLTALVRTGAARGEIAYCTETAPATVKPPAQLRTVEELFGDYAAPVYRTVASKMSDETSTPTAARGLVHSWHRFGQPLDTPYLAAGGLLVVADLTPFRAVMAASGIRSRHFIINSVDLTLSFFGASTLDDWLLSTARSGIGKDGYHHCDIAIWGAKGDVVCRGTSVLVSKMTRPQVASSAAG